ncbi:MAG: N-carbamoyl-D-amino-acid hydrolase [Rhodospirillales bacterium]|nr:N-carbamoyl-D-amino-acid hydrolase [Rhodospirillales bacterium]MBO6786439.1 N-carbamoyl-D-amino-acid hydrolase [Rhodospirillales bacterium]
MSRPLTIAVAQSGAVQKDDPRQANVARLCKMMSDAADQGADIVVFTEIALTTFFPRYYAEDRAEMDQWFEREMPNAATQPLFDLARERGVGFYLGYGELTPEGRHFNTSILVDKEARIVGKYRKVHLPGHDEFDPDRAFQHLEKRYFEPGDLGFPVWDTMGGTMGMCICNDRRWPETFRVMGLKGVELVMLGYNTPSANSQNDGETAEMRKFHNRLTLQAGAYQNSTFVAAAAKAGTEDGHHMFGESCIVAPTGEIIAMAKTEDDELVIAEIDLDDTAFGKATVFDFARHRRIEHYGIISTQTGVTKPSVK